MASNARGLHAHHILLCSAFATELHALVTRAIKARARALGSPGEFYPSHSQLEKHHSSSLLFCYQNSSIIGERVALPTSHKGIRPVVPMFDINEKKKTQSFLQ